MPCKLSRRLHALAAAVAVGLVFQVPIAVGAESSSVSDLERQFLVLESKWQPGVGAAEREYYVRVAVLADGMSTLDPAAVTPLSTKVLRAVLAKVPQSRATTPADFEIGSADLAAIRRLAEVLLAQQNVSDAQQRTNMSMLAEVLGRVRRELIHGYTHRLVFANVAPPPGVRGMAGMAPEAISDPGARQKYRDAILENQRNNLLNKRQMMLAEMDSQLAVPVVGYMESVARSSARGDALLQKAISDARLTDTERSKVLDDRH